MDAYGILLLHNMHPAQKKSRKATLYSLRLTFELTGKNGLIEVHKELWYDKYISGKSL
jgi:uncharacterized protein YxjI